MKYLFINPPCFQLNVAPLPGIPTLMGVLKNKGISCNYIDLNADFVNVLLKSNYIDKYVRLIQNIKNNNIPDAERFFVNNDYENLENISKQIFLYKKFIPQILKTLKFKNNFYNPLLLSQAMDILSKVYGMCGNIADVSIVKNIFPDVMNYGSHLENIEYNIDIELLTSYFNSEIFMLKDYYNSVFEKIEKQSPKCIGITIGFFTQFIPGIMLAYLLKKKTNIHINIGGSFFDDFYYNIKNLKDIFSEFCDSISIKDNTKTVYQIIEYLENKRNIQEIENIIYIENNELKINGQKSQSEYYKLPFPEFYGFNNYILPELVLPVQASYGCYWGKCIFCNCSYNKNQYSIKSVEKFVEELEYLSNKYKTKYFYFWDNALPPKYLDRMCDLLIKKNLKIHYSIFARFEKEFDYKILKKLKKTGCSMIFWGLDSASKRVLEYINKGININTVQRVLKQAKAAKIENFVYIILGHPSETYDELVETYNFCRKLKKYVFNFIVATECLFLDGSIIQNNREYYMKQILTTQKERNIIYKKINDINTNLPFKILYDPFIIIHLLYLSIYSAFKLNIIFHYYKFISKNKTIIKIHFKINSIIKKLTNKIIKKPKSVN